MPFQSISVKVHTNSKKNMLIQLGLNRFEAWVKVKPIQGIANDAIAHLLAAQLKIPIRSIRLVKGWNGRHKLFRIIE